MEECYYIMAAQHLLSDVFLQQHWNWFFHLQTLQNVKTFPSVPGYLVARNRFWNPLLSYLPETLVRLSSQSREQTPWDGKFAMSFIISASFHFYFNHLEGPTFETSVNYFRICCMKKYWLPACLHSSKTWKRFIAGMKCLLGILLMD